MAKQFEGKKFEKLGTEKNPAVVKVQTEDRANELKAVFEKNNWAYSVELDPEKPEDITQLDILLNPVKTIIAEAKVGRNEPCSCGSGLKYKKCCGK